MSGYTSGVLPTVTIVSPSGTQVTSTCTIGGALTVSFAVPTLTTTVATTTSAGLPISSVSLTNPGWYYTTVPLVSITGGGGSGAIVTSTIKDSKDYYRYSYS
jgi:hypothetical protein